MVPANEVRYETTSDRCAIEAHKSRSVQEQIC